ncbi:DUF4893 domain-containing protein [Sphingomonas sp. 1P06PA]|uniref:DUF4893 domain-containing protein n=1 Tax=Sphingomonas sp. 1P06PA TaxID=554121 RepID=UPI0039A72073
MRGIGWTAATLIACAMLAGCAKKAPPPAPVSLVEPQPEPTILDRWQGVATEADAERIARIDTAWADGLAAARRAGAGGVIAQEGALLDPAALAPRALPPPGRYSCRVIKLGGRRGLASFPPYFCFVDRDGPLTILVKETGAERPSGRLWPDGEDRMIFLGGMALGPEHTAPAYNSESDRDVAGVLERVGDFRWRLAMPYQSRAASLDVIELVPFIPNKTVE